MVRAAHGAELPSALPYGDRVIPEVYREFFVAAAGASGALIGLLFVAISVFPERLREAETRVEFQNRASSAMLLFSDALTLSLAALVPDISLGWWALFISVPGLAFTAATVRSIVTAVRRRQARWRSLGLVWALLVIFGFQLYAGIDLIRDGTDGDALQILDYVVIADLLGAIGRAWQLVGMRDTGLMSSFRVLARGDDLAGDDGGDSDSTGTESQRVSRSTGETEPEAAAPHAPTDGSPAA